MINYKNELQGLAQQLCRNKPINQLLGYTRRGPNLRGKYQSSVTVTLGTGIYDANNGCCYNDETNGKGRLQFSLLHSFVVNKI